MLLFDSDKEPEAKNTLILQSVNGDMCASNLWAILVFVKGKTDAFILA